jgi:very-short-patch-repair endonuclease
LLLNRGAREQDGEPRGFTLCTKCHEWLMSDKGVENHIETNERRGDCSRGARRPEDLLRGLWLTQEIRSDLVLLDVPPLEGMEAGEAADEFYTTLLHTWLRALLVAFNLDENELAGFLVPSPAADTPYRLVLYETTVGGSGVLASLPEPARLARVVERARELLHEGDPEGGCERACYACLLSFYNQRDHDWLNRTPVLTWFQSLAEFEVEPEIEADPFDNLLARCESDFEREVLHAIRDRGLRLPDAAQQTIYDGDEPIATSDFFYAPRLLVFVDGSPHYLDYIQTADDRKRRRLQALGYRVVAITPADIEERLEELAGRLT